MRKSLRPLFLFFASLKLAVVLLLSCAIVLAAGTISESLYGMRAAHLQVYGTWWFGGLLFLLGVNVLCAALSRYPWKPHQTGFVVTHLGIIVILVGSFMTQQWGLDGSLPIIEGRDDNEVLLPELTLEILDETSGNSVALPLPERARPTTGDLFRVRLGEKTEIEVDTLYPRAVPSTELVETPLPGMGTPAIDLALQSSRFNVDQRIVVDSPFAPTEVSLGPALLSFEKLWSPADEKRFLASAPEPKKSTTGKGYVLVGIEGREYRLPVDDMMGKFQPIGDSGHSMKVEKYFTHAVVKDNELVNKSPEPLNPAVLIHIRSASGNNETHTLFANFPEFPTLHRRTSGADVIRAKLRMVSAAQDSQRESLSIVGRGRGRLHIAQTADDKRLLYKVLGADGKINGSGELEIGKALPTGWMDASFTVTRWYPAMVERDVPQPVDRIPDSSANYLAAIRYHLVHDGARDPLPRWLMQGDSQRESVGNHKVVVHLTKRSLRLPFKLKLEKFTIGTDPGTTKAASYASDVVVLDKANGIERRAHISMNEPLEYAGHTFYQASYQKEEGGPTISVFAVNRDPGRPVKYAGSLLLVIGIATMFYMNPHYFGVLLGKKATNDKQA